MTSHVGKERSEQAHPGRPATLAHGLIHGTEEMHDAYGRHRRTRANAMMQRDEAAAPLVLGVDAGGTKTTMALADRIGAVQGVVRTSGINPFDQPAWRRLFEELLAKADGAKERIVHACFGMPGFGEVEAISAEQTAAIDEWRASIPVSIMNDVEVAFVGAFGPRPGILLLAGTGSMVWARDDTASALRIGGWGELIGDEGSAFWLGIEALRRLTWILDGRLTDRTFGDALHEATGTRDGDALLRWCYEGEHFRSRVAALAPAVGGLADAGNPTACGLLDAAGGYLWAHACAARRHLRFTDPVAYSYAGGMFSNRYLRDALRRRAEAVGRWVEPLLPPIGGALWRAAEQAGWSTSEGWTDAVRAHLREQVPA